MFLCDTLSKKGQLVFGDKFPICCPIEKSLICALTCTL